MGLPRYTHIYALYAQAHGNKPQAMIEHDRTRWPGGLMCGFMLWVQRAWVLFKTLHDIPVNKPANTHEHNKFDAWLAKNYRTLERDI